MKTDWETIAGFLHRASGSELKSVDDVTLRKLSSLLRHWEQLADLEIGRRAADRMTNDGSSADAEVAN